MSSTLKSLRALSDPTRIRIIALLEKDELSVNELQEITRMGQSRISTHLGLLQDSELVQSRREGKRTFYKLYPESNHGAREFIDLAIRGAKELPEHDSDQINLKRILNRRREQAQVYFNQIAGRFDRVYGPGQGSGVRLDVNGAGGSMLAKQRASRPAQNLFFDFCARQY